MVVVVAGMDRGVVTPRPEAAKLGTTETGAEKGSETTTNETEISETGVTRPAVRVTDGTNLAVAQAV